MRTEQRVSRLGLLSHLAIPFDLNGQKVTVNTSPGGVKVSLKLSELGKYIARYYLSKIGVAAALVEALFDIKFGMSSTLNYNYEKFKTSGLSGLVQSTLCSMACVQLDGVTWKPTGMLTAFSKGKGEKSRPLRSLVLAVKAALNVTPKSKYVPLGGQLVIKYCCQYEEFEDRIDIMFMDVNIKGGLKYTANVDVSLSASLPFFSAPVPHGVFDGQTQPGSLPLHGKSTIKGLSVKDNIGTFGFSYDRRRGQVAFLSNLSREYLPLLVMLVILFFMKMAETPDLMLSWDDV